MHIATMLALQSELEKIAGLGAGALDLAGLGMLAAPTIQKMRGKPMQEKNKDRAELGGLGVLGASVAAEHGKDAWNAAKSGLGKLKGLASKMPKHAALRKEAAPSMSAMMNMHRLADAAKAARPAVQQVATKLPGAAQNAARAAQYAGHTAQGGHAFDAAKAAKRAISIPGLTG